MQGAHGPDSGTDSSLTAVSQLPPSEKMSQPTLAQPQSFSVGQPQPPPPPLGSAAAVPGSRDRATADDGSLAAKPAPGNGAGRTDFAADECNPDAAGYAPAYAAGPSCRHFCDAAAPAVRYLQQHVAGLQPPSPAQPSSTGAGASPATAASLPVGTGQNASSVSTQLLGASSQPNEAADRPRRVSRLECVLQAGMAPVLVRCQPYLFQTCLQPCPLQATLGRP
ncbi:hypothetical protein P7K49_031752 [Saguinus oedipus]|uniref:Uncharacterized protein n=1 Tax=Saguinus oedipus TaxID=9490 RepID=A0ABQ9U0B5_SAGOE|nr:hypothetical protein P7K49_031752 [Saguinus oedipus]